MLEDIEIELKEMEEFIEDSSAKFATNYESLDSVSYSSTIFIEISQCECFEIAILRY